MQIINFDKKLIEQASEIVLMNYAEEQNHCAALPSKPNLPDLNEFLENEFGVAAVEDEKLLGFLCPYNPWDEVFGSTVKGTFIPLHGHGAIKEGRKKIYQMMYEKLAEKLFSQNVLYHSICLFANDADGLSAFFDYGFGKRCVDAIKLVEPIATADLDGIEFSELPLKDFPLIRKMRAALNAHLTKSPCFMISYEEDFKNWIQKVEQGDRRTFVAKKGTEILAYLDITNSGENFVTWRDKMRDIHGAYCEPGYRGSGVYSALLNYVMNVVKKENADLIGVDYESFNPTAANFWPKYFTPYTYSLTRRIDEPIPNLPLSPDF